MYQTRSLHCWQLNLQMMKCIYYTNVSIMLLAQHCVYIGQVTFYRPIQSKTGYKCFTDDRMHLPMSMVLARHCAYIGHVTFRPIQITVTPQIQVWKPSAVVYFSRNCWHTLYLDLEPNWSILVQMSIHFVDNPNN